MKRPAQRVPVPMDVAFPATRIMALMVTPLLNRSSSVIAVTPPSR